MCRHRKKIKKKHLSGFTLPEMLLSVAILGMLVMMTVPVFQSVQVQDDLSLAIAQTGQSWRRAQTLSIASQGDSSWGVYVQTGSITVFKGTSYVLRDSDFDEVFDLSATISFSGPDEVVFAQLTGEPSSAGTLTFTGVNNQEFSVLINEKGMVEY